MTKILLMLFISASVAAQGPTIEWAKCYGGSSDDIPATILQTGDGGYLVGGITLSVDGDITVNRGQNDEWIVKLDGNGVLQWQQTYGGSGQDKAKAIKQTPDGGYIIGGYTNSTDGEITNAYGFYDYWIVKVDSSGMLQWQKSFGGSQDDLAYSIQVTRDSGYVMAGKSKSYDIDASFNRGGYDYWIVKTDDSGNIQWQKSYGGSNDDIATAIRQTRDGGYVVAGTTESDDSDVTGNHGGSDYWVIKLDSAGNLQWQKALGGSSSDTATSIQQCRDGGYIVTGYSSSNDGDVTGNQGSTDYWMVKLDSTGNIQWQKSFGGSQQELAFSVQQTSDDGYFVTGYSFSANGDVTGHHGDTTTSDYWIVKTDSSGNLQWEQSLGGTNLDISIVYSNMQTSDGGYIVGGASESTDGEVSGHHGTTTNADFWIVKLGAATGVEPDHNPLFGLWLYPNPSTGIINIEAQLSASGDLVGEIKNTLGQTIYTFHDQTINSFYKKSIALSLPDGIYFLSLQHNGGRTVKKFEVFR